MEYFYLIINPDKEHAKETAENICRYLKDRGAVCYMQTETPVSFHRGFRYTDKADIPENTQCVITLGGDGTLIQAARDLAGSNLPLVGVNMGTLGYLTQISREEEIAPMLNELVEGNFQLERRMMLHGRVYHEKKQHFQDIALNEIVITRKDLLRVLRLRIYVNEEFLNEYVADGMIIATPTGSTAYNLSAGGPIVAPDAEMMIVTPICPHSLSVRSIVLSAKDHIRIKIAGNSRQEQVAVFDGDSTVELSDGDYIDIRRSETWTTMIKLKDISFLDNLRHKMS